MKKLDYVRLNSSQALNKNVTFQNLELQLPQYKSHFHIDNNSLLEVRSTNNNEDRLLQNSNKSQNVEKRQAVHLLVPQNES